MQLDRNQVFGGIFNGYDSFCSGLPIMGVRVNDSQREVICVLEDPLFLERLTMLRKWYTEGITNPDANTLVNSSEPQPFFSAVGWPGAESLWQRNKGGSGYVSTVVYGPVISTETIQGSMNAISSQSAHKEDALRLLARINLDPVLRDMFAYGVEGTHFVYEDDGVVRQLNQNWNVEVFAQATFFTMSTTTEQPDNQWELVKLQNDRAVSSVLLGFSMNLTELSSEVAACRAVWDRYRVDFLTGAADLDTAIPQCLEELRSAGMDILISEAQKQINAFDWAD
jgi:putative aldouronate transport system substrate-binding protein